MQKLIFCSILVFFFISVFSQEQFEGEVDYVKTSYSDTLYYVYTIKDDYIRIDEYDKYKRATSSYIVNLQDQSVMVIHPGKRLYTTLEKFPVQKDSAQNMEVVYTGNYKYINGYKCSQWRVKNYDENTEITYWMAGDNFNFYAPMSQLAMSFDHHFLFYHALPERTMQGLMPMMIEDKTLLRSHKSTSRVIGIRSHPVDPSVFSLSEYQRFENLR